MTQSQLDRAVAQATGESRRTIAHRGFTIVGPGMADLDDDTADSPPSFIDWDELDADRHRRAA